MRTIPPAAAAVVVVVGAVFLSRSAMWSATTPDSPSAIAPSILANDATQPVPEPLSQQRWRRRGGGIEHLTEALRYGDPLRARSQGPREFYFSRAAYTGYYEMRGFRNWSVDFPKADRQFLIGLQRLVKNIDAFELENPVRLTDQELGRFPFLYTVEVGYMSLTEEEVSGLRRYLMAGGFLVVDDFWGTYEFENFQREFQRVLPGYSIVDIPLDHPIFSCYYDVEEIVQVPNVGQGMQGGPTWENDGYYPAVKGIFDDNERLMVVVNWNTDLGDAWEWAENPYYPLRFSTYAYQMGVNFIIYAMSH